MADAAVDRNSSPRGSRARDPQARAKKKLVSRRTTVALSPEAQAIVERFKSVSGTSTSAAIDQIIQRSEPKPSRLKDVGGFLVLDLPAADRQSVHFTLEDIKKAEDEIDREYVAQFAPRKKRSVSNRNSAGIRA